MKLTLVLRNSLKGSFDFGILHKWGIDKKYRIFKNVFITYVALILKFLTDYFDFFSNFQYTAMPKKVHALTRGALHK